MPPSASKAREMLHDNSAQGHPLTARQKRYFGMLAHPHKKKKRKTAMTRG